MSAIWTHERRLAAVDASGKNLVKEDKQKTLLPHLLLVEECHSIPKGTP